MGLLAMSNISNMRKSMKPVYSCLHEVSFASTSYLELYRSTSLNPVGCCKWHPSGRSSSSSTTAERDHILCLGAGFSNAIFAVVEMGIGKTGRQLRWRCCCNFKVTVFVVLSGFVQEGYKAPHLREMSIGGTSRELYGTVLDAGYRLCAWRGYKFEPQLLGTLCSYSFSATLAELLLDFERSAGWDWYAHRSLVGEPPFA